MSTIKKQGNKLIDINYYSKKFGWIEIDITTVEREPTHETLKYLRELKNRK